MKRSFENELFELRVAISQDQSVDLIKWGEKIYNLRADIKEQKVKLRDILDNLNKEEGDCNELMATMMRTFANQQPVKEESEYVR